MSARESEAPLSGRVTERRSGDRIAVPGDYQFRSLHEGHAAQRFWHFNKQRTVARYLPARPGQLVVDVGCGSGVVSDFLAQSGASVIGIDGNDAALTFARQTFRRENLRFEKGLVDRDFQLPRPADAIYCLEVIEHIYPAQAAEMLRVFHRRLAPGGHIYLTTPNAHSMWPALEWMLDTFQLVPSMAGHQHVAAYTRGTLARLCEESGFIIEHLVTTCLFAPWIAPISWKLALATDRLETGSRLGCLLVCVARKRGD
jgi:2-polyprenyl-3-methyl-5-hydroxy-6-metoxy-1,4-benzoquinol methylase